MLENFGINALLLIWLYNYSLCGELSDWLWKHRSTPVFIILLCRMLCLWLYNFYVASWFERNKRMILSHCVWYVLKERREMSDSVGDILGNTYKHCRELVKCQPHVPGTWDLRIHLVLLPCKTMIIWKLLNILSWRPQVQILLWNISHFTTSLSLTISSLIKSWLLRSDKFHYFKLVTISYFGGFNSVASFHVAGMHFDTLAGAVELLI